MRYTCFSLLTVLLLALSSCHKDKEEIVVNEIHVDTNLVYEFKPSFIIENQKEITDDIVPDLLKEGDYVAVCAASNYVTESEISEGIETLKSWNLNVVEASNIYHQESRYAGTLAERISEFQKMVDNKDIKAIFFVRGGYGAAQILPYINWDKMLENPKWIIGYSDVTALHIALNNLGVETISGLMLRGFNNSKESVDNLKRTLFEAGQEISIVKNSNCVEGTASGRLVGGNLSLIYSLSGTAFDLNTKNAILFIEDVEEANYAIDRMLLNLQQSGKLQEIKGLIVGDFLNCKQGSDLPLNEIISKYFGNLNIPIVYGIPVGHDTKNLSLVMGSRVMISVDDKTASITYPKVSK